MNDKGDEVRFSILAEGAEDYLSFHDFLWEVHETLGIWDPAATRAQVLTIIKCYLESGDVVPGFPVDQGPEFAAWSLPVDEAMAWINKAWDELDREPVTGDICWFISTDKGKEWVRQYRESNPQLPEPEA